MGSGSAEQLARSSGYNLLDWTIVRATIYAATIIQTNLYYSCVFPVLAQAFTQNWWSLLICRLFMGLGMELADLPNRRAETDYYPRNGRQNLNYSRF
jgi:MFS family permease